MPDVTPLRYVYDAGNTVGLSELQAGETIAASCLPTAREVLTAARTYYVATTGSDSNNGLAVGTPFLTIQKAVDVVSSKLDLGGFVVSVQLADGTYTTPFVMKSLVGGNKITITGNVATPANVIISTGSTAVTSSVFGMKLEVINMKITTSVGHGLLATVGGVIEFGNIVFGACASFHTAATTGGTITAVSNYEITGGAAVHHFSETHASIIVSAKTVTLTGTPAFSSYFAGGSFLGGMLLNANTYSGGATGIRYQLAGNSAINTSGAATTYLPGSVAGTTATGGQYV